MHFTNFKNICYFTAKILRSNFKRITQFNKCISLNKLNCLKQRLKENLKTKMQIKNIVMHNQLITNLNRFLNILNGKLKISFILKVKNHKRIKTCTKEAVKKLKTKLYKI